MADSPSPCAPNIVSDDNLAIAEAVSVAKKGDFPETEESEHEPSAPDTTKAKRSNDVIDSPTQSTINSKKKKYLFGGVIVAVAFAVILSIALTSKDPPTTEEPSPFADFSTGVSLVTEYHVNSKILSRLAQSTIKLEVANALSCSSIHSISLQLPLNTRITSLTTSADDGCTTNGKVQHLEEARETFLESASQRVIMVSIE